MRYFLSLNQQFKCHCSHYFNFLSLTPTKKILSVVFVQMKYQHAASNVTLLTVADVNLEPHSQQMNQYSFC